MSEENTEETSDLSPKLQNAMQLTSALCDDRITPEQFRELESLVCNDPEVARFYVSMIHLDASLHRFASYFSQPMSREDDIDILSGERVRDGGRAFGMDESMVLPAITEPEFADSNELAAPYQVQSQLSEKLRPRTDGSRSLYLKGGFAALLAVGVGLWGYVLLSHKVKSPAVNVVGIAPAVTPTVPAATTEDAILPPPVPIATVELAANPVWGTTDLPPHDANFVAGQSLSLKSGDVQLLFHRGGRLVVEGPAELEFVSDAKISLHRGKIVATIPGGGLVVVCPMGLVTDLGTEFGLAVDSNGGTEVAVFQGRVSASLSSTATTQGTKELLLKVGQAATMTDKALALTTDGAAAQRFVCSLVNGKVTSLDVTDLISGGNGTTHRRGIGIDANTGAIGALPPTETRVSDGKYHQVRGYPVIDGACIADGTKGPMVVDSAGHQFQFLSVGNSAYNNIYTGGRIPWPVAREISTVLDGVDYATLDHGLICIHPNNALTLDLDAIRRIYPDRTLASFHCRVGNTAPASPKPTHNAVATAYVLVDGIARYMNPHVTSPDGSVIIDVPLQQHDRFLTLVSTDSRKAGIDDWILWTDAELNLSAGH